MYIMKSSAFDGMIENRTFDEIAIGDSASLSRKLSQQDIDLFAIISGDINPVHMDPVYAKTDIFHQVIAHGMLGAGLISSVLGTILPGPGTIYLGQDLRFLQPLAIGDTITASLNVTEKHPDNGGLVLDCRCINQNGQLVISGTAHVRAPTEKVRRPRIELPDVQLSRHRRFRALLAAATGHPPLATAVAYPCDANALGAAVEAALAGFITPILVGPKDGIAKAAEMAKVDITAFRLVDVADSEAAAAAAVALVRQGEATLLMKGSLHTDQLLHAVLARDSGLRTSRRLSHVCLMDVPSYPRPLLVTDAAVSSHPILRTSATSCKTPLISLALWE
jgi:acyl dehydratase